ncbi:hypothetical protein [Geobacillus kaustophilus]|nr:hypothetical protein [Geobacillus kaustophilus]
MQQLSIKLYEQAAKQAQSAGSQGGAANHKDNVVDAEFEEVNDDK